VAILWFTRVQGRRGETAGREITEMTPRMALLIGLAQAVALWPGISRSLVTIIGGVLLGLGLPAAVEFSFLLGLLTLTAATGWEVIHEGREMLGAYGWGSMAVGFVSAFVAAVVSVKWMVAFLNWRELNLFGYYRIVLAALTVVLLAIGVL
jgi:undecaprenyl-diphosphatase